MYKNTLKNNYNELLKHATWKLWHNNTPAKVAAEGGLWEKGYQYFEIDVVANFEVRSYSHA